MFNLDELPAAVQARLKKLQARADADSLDDYLATGLNDDATQRRIARDINGDDDSNVPVVLLGQGDYRRSVDMASRRIDGVIALVAVVLVIFIAAVLVQMGGG